MPCYIREIKMMKTSNSFETNELLSQCFLVFCNNCCKYFYLKIVTIVSFYALWKHRKTKGFLIFSGGMKSDQCNYFCLKSPEAANGVALYKGCSWKFRKFHRKALVMMSLFNKVESLLVYNFMKKRLKNKCFPVKFTEFLNAPILKNICSDDCS